MPTITPEPPDGALGRFGLVHKVAQPLHLGAFARTRQHQRLNGHWELASILLPDVVSRGPEMPTVEPEPPPRWGWEG